MISEETIEQIKEKTDLVLMAIEATEAAGLKRIRNDLWLCCPFHEEKTASFKIDVEKRTWYCFSCSEGGDAISFVMKIDGISFIEAVDKLARLAGISLDADDLENSNREIEALFEWLRGHHLVGAFDEAKVAERYISLLAEREQTKATDKSEWARASAKRVRSELIQETLDAYIARQQSLTEPRSMQ